MTREEAIRILDGLKPNTAIAYGNETAYSIGQALSMAINALTFRDKAEVVISQLRADRDRLEDELAKREQEPKTGHWIKSRDCYGNNHFTCPFCEHDIATKYADTWEDNYCSNCGCRMVEPQESEDKG